MQRFLILLGVVILVVGLVWPWVSKLPLGRLPGDFDIHRENFSFYFPLTTSLLISGIITLILWFLRK